MGRFYTGDGQFVGMKKLPNACRSLLQSLRRRMTGQLPDLPWIPFSAATAIDQILTRESRVWEVGAGQSTLWLARRAGHVTSIEASVDWYNQLCQRITQQGIDNVNLRHEWVAEQMADFSSVEDSALDLLYVDGGPRGLCFTNGFRKVRPGGWIYLDNWDSQSMWEGARAFLAETASAIASSQSFVDYVPAQVGVYEGLLLQKSDGK